MGKEIYLIDTNVFLEALLDQERSQECIDFLFKFYKGELEGCITSFSLHSIELSLIENDKADDLIIFLKLIISSNTLLVYNTTPQEEIEIIKILQQTGLDFDDAIHYYLVKKNGFTLVSLDQDFDKTDIKRQEPNDI